MSFRTRLLLFFTIIVIVPMGAVALVLFSITSQSEIGKADARIAEGMRVALASYRQERSRGVPALRRVAADPALRRALNARSGGEASKVLDGLVKGDVTGIALYDGNRKLIASAGENPALAPAVGAPTDAHGKQFGWLAVSTLSARVFANRVAELTDLGVRVYSGRQRLASTIQGDAGGVPPASGKVKVGGDDYRGRFEQLEQQLGAPISVGVFTPSGGITDSIDRSRVLIGIILLGFLGLALVLSVFIVRALQGQIDQFLQAARRLARGDFSQPVPIHGDDEFAKLGGEFNKMSHELEVKIEEVESKRRELEETIRRVGDAFATGLDRQGLIDLAVRMAVKACEADAGRALPLETDTMEEVGVGNPENTLLEALELAERRAFAIREESVAELIANLDPSRDQQMPVEQHRPTVVSMDGVHALAGPLRARSGAGSDVNYVCVISIVRRGQEFSATEQDLFAYLTAQAAVSIENANLHETAQRLAVTDELTGLFNVRHFQEALENEVERSRRFSSPVGLAMLDIDNFKRVNDTYGHQQGDVVLVEVARALRSLSRDIDVPARYGGEELAVILPQTDLSGAELLAERMRAAVADLAVKRLDGQGVLKITASFGVAAFPESADGRESLIAAADAALYRAKHGGKNQVQRADAVQAAT
jgi:diguanylate cyclase (GGDEF)-like protein